MEFKISSVGLKKIKQRLIFFNVGLIILLLIFTELTEKQSQNDLHASSTLSIIITVIFVLVILCILIYRINHYVNNKWEFYRIIVNSEYIIREMRSDKVPVRKIDLIDIKLIQISPNGSLEIATEHEGLQIPKEIENMPQIIQHFHDAGFTIELRQGDFIEKNYRWLFPLYIFLFIASLLIKAKLLTIIIGLILVIAPLILIVKAFKINTQLTFSAKIRKVVFWIIVVVASIINIYFKTTV